MQSKPTKEPPGAGFCFHLLGQLLVTRGGAPLPEPPHRAVGLLAALLLRPSPQRRERLIGLLFPDMPESAGRRRLSDLLWLLRQSMPDLPLQADAQEVFLPPEARCLDVEAFKEAAAGGLAGWLEALRLYRGDLLEGVYEDWLLEERESLRLQFIRVSHRACDELLRQGRMDELLPVAERLTQAEPYDEKALRALLAAYQAVGRRGAALAAYDRFVALAADELEAAPEPATQALAQSIRVSEPKPWAAPSTSADDAPDALLRSARAALASGDQQGAETGLRLLRARPDCRDEDARLLGIDLALFAGDHDRAERLLDAARPLRAPQMARAARLALDRHDPARAQSLAADALMLAHDAADRSAELESLLALAAAQRELGQHPQAIRSAERALALARQIRSPDGIAGALTAQGSGQLSQGRYAQALACFHEARSAALEGGLRHPLAVALRGIRVAQLHTNRLAEALATIEEELSIWRDLGLPEQEARALEGLALILDYLGRSADSLRAMEQALEISEQLGDPVRIAVNRYNLAYTLLYHDDDNAPHAAEVARQALDAFRAHNQRRWESVALTALGYALWVSGEHGEALASFRQAHALSEELGKLGYLPELLAYQGLANLGLQRPAEALALTRQAVLQMAQGEVSQEVVPEIYYAHAATLAANGMDGQAGAYFAQAYEHLLQSASEFEDEAARQAFFHRNPTMRRLMRELSERGMAAEPCYGIVSQQLSASHGARPVRVLWTVDAGPPDAALRQAKGAIALRRSRLARLLREAASQGARPTPAQLAGALGVSARTIQRDLEAMREA